MKENLEILANWWAEQVFSQKMNWDNGDESSNGGITFLLANMLAQKSRQNSPPDAAEKFKSIFVEKALEFHSEFGRLPDFSVDYHPSPFLRAVAEEAGVLAGAFPCKSHSAIIDGKPFAKCGYGKKLVDLSEAIAH